MLDWSSYARQYDLMSENNPAYQQIVEHCAGVVSEWELQPGDAIADFGAGTGNFSIVLAQALPRVSVLHIDSNDEMIRLAEMKAVKADVPNWRVVRQDLESDDWCLPGLAGAVTVHALYCLKEPKKTIAAICAALNPGSHLYAADFGRTMDVCDWARYLVPRSIKRNGFLRTAALLARTGAVRRENRRLSECQRAGYFWLHDLPEFCAVFENLDMEITYTSNTLYRGYDDVIVAKKIANR